MMKITYFAICLFFLCSSVLVQAQNYSDTEIATIQSNSSAGEGDLYNDTVNKILYIGASSGKLFSIQDLYHKDGKIIDDRTVDVQNNVLSFINVDTFDVSGNVMNIDTDTLIVRGGLQLSSDLEFQNLEETTEISTAIVVDSNGVLYKRPHSEASVEVILIDPTPKTITGAGFVNFHSFTIPGGTLGENHAVRITIFLRRTSGNSNIRLRTSYGGTTMASMPSGNGNTPAKTEVLIYGRNSVNSQGAYIYHSNSGSNGLGFGIATEDSDQDQTFIISGDLGNDAHQWICDFLMVEAIR